MGIYKFIAILELQVSWWAWQPSPPGPFSPSKHWPWSHVFMASSMAQVLGIGIGVLDNTCIDFGSLYDPEMSLAFG